MELQAIEPRRDERKLENDAMTWSETAKTLRVRDQQTHDFACQTLTAIKALRTAAEAHHRPTISSAWNTHKLACEALNKIDKPLAEAELLLKQGIGAWELQQQRLLEQRERESREAAERVLAEQREAEIEAIEAEHRTGQATLEEVRAVVEAPIIITQAPVPQTYQRAPGVSSTFPYKATCENKLMLLRYIADHQQYANLLDVNESALNKLASALKATLQLPGVRVYQDVTVRSRGR